MHLLKAVAQSLIAPFKAPKGRLDLLLLSMLRVFKLFCLFFGRRNYSTVALIKFSLVALYGLPWIINHLVFPRPITLAKRGVEALRASFDFVILYLGLLS